MADQPWQRLPALLKSDSPSSVSQTVVAPAASILPMGKSLFGPAVPCMITPEMLDFVHSYGGIVNVWTVDEPERAEELFRYFFEKYTNQGHQHGQPLYFGGFDENGDSFDTADCGRKNTAVHF